MSDVSRTEPARLTTGQLLTISLAAGLVPLNSTMIAVALPAISDDFDVGTSKVSMLVTAYLVVMLVGQPVAGRLADRLGSKRTVEYSLVGLAAISFAAVFAPAFWFLAAARAMQALCTAALNPATQSLLTSVSPPVEHGRVFGTLGSVLGVGASAGPVVGGALVALFGWEAVFAANIPVAIAAMFALRAVTPPPAQPSPPGDTAHGPGRILNSTFVAGYSGQALSTFAQYALLILTPLVLDARGWSAGWIGLALSALTIGMIVMGPIGGRLGDRLGRRRPSLTGLSVATGAVVMLAAAGRSVEPLILIIALGCFGLGLGATTPNLQSAALGSVPRDRTGAAAGVFATSRYIGSIATTVLIAASVGDDATGARVVLVASAGCLAASLVAAARLPGPTRS